MTLAAVLWTVTLGDLALLHVAWAMRFWVPLGDEARLAAAAVGTREGRMPSPIACLALAVGLGVAASLPWWDAFGLGRAALLSLAVILALRGAAAYHPSWARLTPAPAFRQLDMAAYGPLCLALAGLAATLAALG